MYSDWLIILLTKTTAMQNGVVLSYRKLCGLYFLAVVFVIRIVLSRVGPFFKAYFAHLLFCRAHFPHSHGMFLFAYNFQEPSGICIFLTSNFYI